MIRAGFHTCVRPTVMSGSGICPRFRYELTVPTRRPRYAATSVVVHHSASASGPVEPRPYLALQPSGPGRRRRGSQAGRGRLDCPRGTRASGEVAAVIIRWNPPPPTRNLSPASQPWGFNRRSNHCPGDDVGLTHKRLEFVTDVLDQVPPNHPSSIPLVVVQAPGSTTASPSRSLLRTVCAPRIIDPGLHAEYDLDEQLPQDPHQIAGIPPLSGARLLLFFPIASETSLRISSTKG